MVVGAGFATGREVMLYFYGANVATIALAGAMLGVVFALFLIVARSGVYQYMKNTLIGRVVQGVMLLVSVSSLVVMTAGAEELVGDLTGLPFVGVISTAIAGIIASRGMRHIKNINLVIVPLLIALIGYLTHGGVGLHGGAFMAHSATMYVGLNMLMAGYLLMESGEKMSSRDIGVSSIAVALVFSVLLYAVLRSACVYKNGAMPLYLLATSKGAKVVGGIIIYLSILSTLLGDALLVYDNIYVLTHHKYIAILSVMTIGIMSHFITFASAVAVVYKVQSVVGIVFIIYVFSSYVLQNVRVHRRVQLSS